MNRHGKDLLYKKLTLIFYFLKVIVADICERDCEKEGNEDRLPYLPITPSSLDNTSLCNRKGLTYLPLLLPGQGELRAVAPPGACRPVSVTDVSRLKTLD